MKHDFTIENYDAFCAMIHQINDDDWHSITDWFGDRYLDVKHWLEDLGLISYTNNMETYYRELLDRKNASIDAITEVFENISDLDTAFSNEQAGHLGYCKGQFEVYREYVAALMQTVESGCTTVAEGGKLSDCFNASRIQQAMKQIADKLANDLAAVLFTADTFSSVPESYKEEYIEVYESHHPEQSKLIESVLSDPDLTEQEKRDIKFLIYSAPEPYRTIYLQHIDKYKVAVFQPGSADSDGVDGSCYWKYTGKIYLTDNDDTFVKNPRGPYNTFFHESGHALDDYESIDGKGGSMTSRRYVYNGKSLHDYIVDDVRDYVSDFIDEKYPNLSKDQKQQLLKSLNLTDDASFDYEGDVAGLDPALKRYRKKIISDMYKDLRGPVHEAASDVFGGVTNNAILGSYGHRKDASQSGSSYDYWYKNGTATRSQDSELWAEFFAAKMTQDEEALASIKAHFPSAYEAMESMAREMAASQETSP